MEKLIYVLKLPDEAGRTALAARLLDEVIPFAREKGASDITVNVADLDHRMSTPQTLTPRIYGEWSPIAGVIHFWLDSLDDREPIERALSGLCRPEGYLVTESIVQKHAPTWSEGERRPGVTQVALGQKPRWASDEHFYHHWQVVHSAWSFDLHPHRQSYVRNAVARVLTPSAPKLAFIVLEHFAEMAHFTDESLYYRSAEHVQRLWAEVPDFLDLESYTGGPASEYHFE